MSCKILPPPVLVFVNVVLIKKKPFDYYSNNFVFNI